MNKKRWGIVLLALVLAVTIAAVGLVPGSGDNPVAAKDNSIPKVVRNADVSGDCVAVLGLGAGPVFYPDRNNTGFALFHNGDVYLIDCGMDDPDVLANLGVTFDKVAGLFFTHYHIDHTAGYADLLSRGSQANNPNQLKTLDVYGPTLPEEGGVNGLDVLTDGILAAFAPGYELHFWARPYLPPPPMGPPPGAPAPRPLVTTHPITPNLPEDILVITVLDDPNMLVEAIEVDHDEDFGTCYAYRFTLLDGNEADPQPTGKVIVFSGDRADYNARRDENSAYYASGGPGEGTWPYFDDGLSNAAFQMAFRDFADGATVLVHEAAKSDSATLIADPNSDNPFFRALYWHLIDSHTDVGDIPQIAQDANVSAVVLNHYGDYTDGNLEAGRSVILSGVLKANAKVGYQGKIIAPFEGDVIRF